MYIGSSTIVIMLIKNIITSNKTPLYLYLGVFLFYIQLKNPAYAGFFSCIIC